MTEITSITSQDNKREGAGFFYFSFFLLLASLIFCLIFFALEKKAATEIDKIQKQLKKEEPAHIIVLKEKLEDLQRKIPSFKVIFEEHIFPSKIFTFIEENTHPKVFIKFFNFDLNNSTISLVGQTEDFFTLGQQILALESLGLDGKSEISNLKLEKVSIADDKKIEFQLTFNFNKEIARPKIEDLKKEINEGL